MGIKRVMRVEEVNPTSMQLALDEYQNDHGVLPDYLEMTSEQLKDFKHIMLLVPELPKEFGGRHPDIPSDAYSFNGLPIMVVSDAAKAPPPRCETCAWSRVSEQWCDLYVCHANPPTHHGFPHVRTGDFCSHWRSR